MLSVIKNIIFTIAIIMMLYGGIIFTKKFKFNQFNIKKMLSAFKSNNRNMPTYKTLMMSLAAKIGVGSLAGVALAIYFGGPGTLVWMWIISLLTSPNTYAESILGKIFQEKDHQIYKGGPSYYIYKGLKNKKLAILYSLMLIFTFIIGFNTIQSNTISKILNETYSFPYIYIGIALAIVTFLVIVRDNRKIINFTSGLVPVMTIIYIFIFIYVLISNYCFILPTLKTIFYSAFNFKTFQISIVSTIIIGMQKGIFTTEAGLGTGAIAASITDDNREKVGYIQMFGVNFTALVICTSTAFIILLSNYGNLNYININGIELVRYAFNYHLGNFGNTFLIIIICLFAFSTIISGYYFGECSLKFFIPQISGKNILIFKLLTILLIIIGSVSKPGILWNLADIFIALLGIINMYAIIKLKNMI